MIDWSQSMEQSFEYRTVDPYTWRDVKTLKTVKTATITRDAEAETLGSATIDIGELVGESYIRIYLITVQNGIRQEHPLATVLAQSPSSSFDGMVRTASMDAYTPLMELKEKLPPIGYFVPKGANIMDWAYERTVENLRAPVVRPVSDVTAFDDFVADPNNHWLAYNKMLVSKAKFSYGLDELGRVIFIPNRDITGMEPVCTYDDDNSSILHPPVTMEHNMFMVPNVVEVIYSHGSGSFHVRVENRDPDSPASIQNRGREIVRRITDLNLVGVPTKAMVEEYARQTLKELSTVVYSIVYTHAYCPVRLGDCVRLNYKRAGLTNIKGKVISQTIKCEPGCPVTEKAVFLTKLWE